MENKIYAINDIKSEVYEAPIVMSNDLKAIRDIGDFLRDPSNKYLRHISDYRIMCLGTYDSNTGIIKGLEAPRFIIAGENLVEKEKKENGN